MKIRTVILATFAGLTPFTAQTFALEFPASAVQTAKKAETLGSTAIPVGPFASGSVQTEYAEGALSAEAWKIPNASLSTLQIMAPLRKQLAEEGYEIVLDCATAQCGGFDFRYEIDLLPEPEMHVDLGDYRYLSARRISEEKDPEFVSLMVSKSANTGFVQLTRVGEFDESSGAIVASTKSSDPAFAPLQQPRGALATLLNSVGRAPLEDLSFQTGSSNLGTAEFASLAELAAFLEANPDRSVALVGHTDAEGSLTNNLALSKKRAASVLQRLVSAYGIPQHQVEAAGVGYLSPRASNLTDDGRTKNRRVEVILTSTR